MELILWRHADAEDGIPDSARALTEKGRAQAGRMAAWLSKRVESPLVLVSPALRAQQTARAFADVYVTEPAIDVDAEADAVLRVAGWPHRSGTVVVVGHQPTLGQVAARLLNAAQSDWPLKKGAIVWFESRPSLGSGAATLVAALTPELLKHDRH